VQQDKPPAAAGEGTQKALAPGPADESAGSGHSSAIDNEAIAIGGRTVSLPEKSAYHETLIELSDEFPENSCG